MRISDWSSDVCSSDLGPPLPGDLGKPILEHQQSTMVAIDPADQERQQAEAAERDRQLAELKAARESGVLVQGRQGSGGGEGVSVKAAPSAPTDKATAPRIGRGSCRGRGGQDEEIP